MVVCVCVCTRWGLTQVTVSYHAVCVPITTLSFFKDLGYNNRVQSGTPQCIQPVTRVNSRAFLRFNDAQPHTPPPLPPPPPHTHIHTHAYTHIHIHTHTHTHRRLHTILEHACTHTHTHIHTRILHSHTTKLTCTQDANTRKHTQSNVMFHTHKHKLHTPTCG